MRMGRVRRNNGALEAGSHIVDGEGLSDAYHKGQQRADPHTGGLAVVGLRGLTAALRCSRLRRGGGARDEVPRTAP